MRERGSVRNVTSWLRGARDAASKRGPDTFDRHCTLSVTRTQLIKAGGMLITSLLRPRLRPTQVQEGSLRCSFRRQAPDHVVALEQGSEGETYCESHAQLDHRQRDVIRCRSKT